MPPKLRNAHRLAPRLAGLAAAAVLVATLVAGCASASNQPPAASGPIVLATLDPALIPSRPPIPSHSPSSRPRPSATPRATPTPAPAKTAIEKLKIGSPYTLVYNPANPALSASLTINIGGLTVKETISGREVRQRGTLVGLAYVVEASGVPMNDAALQGAARGAAATSGGKVSYGTVLGHKVAYVVAKTASFAMFLDGDHLVMVGAASLAVTKTLLQSVIKANT
jgi:hypothetical protein